MATRRSGLSFLFVLLVASAAAFAPQDVAVAIQTKPATDWSFYVRRVVSSDAYTLGCNQGNHDTLNGQKNSLVVLDFGIQNAAGTGTYLIESGTFVTHLQIRTYAAQFAEGYWDCTGSNTSSKVRLAIGTNNSVTGRVDYSLGSAWADMVDGVISDTASYASQVIIYGAIDAEPSWDYASNAVGWASGFDASTSAFYYNYGSADGCPSASSSNGACNNGWYQEDLWQISWGQSAALAFPEIYFQVNAEQWAMISEYGAIYEGQAITFGGPLDNYWFDSSSNTDQQAWDDLWTEINSSSWTAGNLMFSGEMHYSDP